MKRILTFAITVLAAISANAQSYNLFSSTDVDKDGWLWLDTQAKIDKYVGLINEDDYTVDPDGMPIQMAYANVMPDYPETYADPDVLGVDTGGYTFADEGVKSEELIKGAIVIAPASAQSSTNGGCLVLNLPSCVSIDLMLSSEASMLGRTLMLSPTNAIDNDNSTGEYLWTGDTKSIYSKATLFSRLHSAGQWEWTGIESLNNGYNEGITFKSDGPVYFALQNCHRYPIYVHAIRVMTKTKREDGVPTGISDFSSPTAAIATAAYNLAGQRVSPAYRGIQMKGGRKVLR